MRSVRDLEQQHDKKTCYGGQKSMAESNLDHRKWKICMRFAVPRWRGAMLFDTRAEARSERQLMEQLDYNLLFRWFVGVSIDDPVGDATVFCKNRDRLL